MFWKLRPRPPFATYDKNKINIRHTTIRKPESKEGYSIAKGEQSTIERELRNDGDADDGATRSLLLIQNRIDDLVTGTIRLGKFNFFLFCKPKREIKFKKGNESGYKHSEQAGEN